MEIKYIFITKIEKKYIELLKNAKMESKSTVYLIIDCQCDCQFNELPLHVISLPCGFSSNKSHFTI